jgi:hypothetical protein
LDGVEGEIRFGLGEIECCELRSVSGMRSFVEAMRCRGREG